MQEKMVTPRSAPEGSVSTRRLKGTMVETTYRGRITAEMADQVRRDILPLLESIKGMDWLIDATHATTFETAPRESTMGVVEAFQRHGGRRIAAVVPRTGIRMVVAALVFATGLPIKVFASRDEALDHLRNQTV
jgi:hypothetical protein